MSGADLPYIAATSFHFGYRSRVGWFKSFSIDDVSFSVGPGEVVALVGPNGAGKTTLMSAFLGFLRPHKGEVALLGQTPVPGAPVFEQVAYLPEEPHYHLYLTVEEALDYYAKLSKRPAGEVEKVIDRFELGPFRKRRLEACSKGIRQKTGLAQAAMGEAKIALFDEPTRGLDPHGVGMLKDTVDRLRNEGAAVLLNTHALAECESMADRVLVIRDGRLLADENMAALRSSSDLFYDIAFDTGGRTIRLPDWFLPLEGTEEGVTRGKVPRDKGPGLVAALVERGVSIHEMTLRKPTLEEAYFSLIEREVA